MNIHAARILFSTSHSRKIVAIKIKGKNFLDTKYYSKTTKKPFARGKCDSIDAVVYPIPFGFLIKALILRFKIFLPNMDSVHTKPKALSLKNTRAKPNLNQQGKHVNPDARFLSPLASLI